MPARQLLISVLLIAPFLGATAHAQQTYFGGNLALLAYDTPDFDRAPLVSPAVVVTGLYGRVGFGGERDIFRGELRFGRIEGEEDAHLVLGSDARDARMEESGSLIGVYALIGMPAESTVRLYALLGYSLTDWEQSFCFREFSGPRCVEEEDDISGTSLGFGMDISVSNGWIVNIEYARYLDKTVWVGGLSVGISLPFSI